MGVTGAVHRERREGGGARAHRLARGVEQRGQLRSRLPRLPLPGQPPRLPRHRSSCWDRSSTPAPNGEQEGFDAIALAARHPDGAPFICTKLVRRFVHDDPPFLLVDACATAFVAHAGRRRSARAGHRADPEVARVPALPGVPQEQGEAAGRAAAEPAARGRRRSRSGRDRLPGHAPDARRSRRAHPQRRSADRVSRRVDRVGEPGRHRAALQSARDGGGRRTRRAGASRARSRARTSSTT